MENTFPERLKMLTKAMNISGSEFGRRAGINRLAVSRMMTGTNLPGFDHLAAILRAFPGMNPRWFLLGEGHPFLGDDDEARRLNKTMFSNFECPECSEKQCYINTLRELNDMLKEKVAKLEEDCEKIKNSKRGKVA